VVEYINFYRSGCIINVISLVYILVCFYNSNKKNLSIRQILSAIILFSNIKLTFFFLIVSVTILPLFVALFFKLGYLLKSFAEITFLILYVTLLFTSFKYFYYIQSWLSKDVNFKVSQDKFIDYKFSYDTRFFIRQVLCINLGTIFFLGESYQIMLYINHGY
jgi:hypothetical protein